MILKSARNAPKKSCKVAKIDFGFEGGYNNVKNKIYIRLFNIKLPALSSHLCQPYLYSLKLIYSPLFAIFFDMMVFATQISLPFLSCKSRPLSR